MPCLVSGMRYDNAYFITGTAYAGKSTMTRLLAERHSGILCEENYHDRLLPELDKREFPCLTYTRDLEDWHDFIRRSPEEYAAWIDGAARECEILELRILDEPMPAGQARLCRYQHLPGNAESRRASRPRADHAGRSHDLRAAVL